MHSENPFGSSRRSYELSEGRLVVRQQMALKRTTEPKESVDHLIGNASKVDLPSIVFKTE